MNWLNTLGLCFDIAGAILLGRAIVWNSKQKIAMQVATSWGYNKNFISAVAEQQADGIFGLTILVGGFVMQGISGWWTSAPIAVFWIGLALLGLMTFCYVIALKWLVPMRTASVVEFIEAWIARRTT